MRVTKLNIGVTAEGARLEYHDHCATSTEHPLGCHVYVHHAHSDAATAKQPYRSFCSPPPPPPPPFSLATLTVDKEHATSHFFSAAPSPALLPPPSLPNLCYQPPPLLAPPWATLPQFPPPSPLLPITPSSCHTHNLLHFFSGWKSVSGTSSLVLASSVQPPRWLCGKVTVSPGQALVRVSLSPQDFVNNKSHSICQGRVLSVPLNLVLQSLAKTECDYLYGWIKKRPHTQKSHPKWWTPEIWLGNAE